MNPFTALTNKTKPYFIAANIFSGSIHEENGNDEDNRQFLMINNNILIANNNFLFLHFEIR